MKRVKIGKNLSIPDRDCRNIVCIRNPARLVECGGPRSTDTSRLGLGNGIPPGSAVERE